MSKKDLSIYYFSSTHWDREWYQTFQGFRYRLVNMMNEVVDVLEKDPEFKVFHFDGQTIVLEDFIEIEPEKKDRLAHLIRDRRLLVGPWYVMPDEFLLSGESLIRNLMLGHRIARQWGSEVWKFGYICDIFGHIAQMPQIFNGFGIRYSLLGRGTNEHNCPAHFRWQAPDGSECITFKLIDAEGYGAFCVQVIGYQNNHYKELADIAPKLKNYIEFEKSRTELPVVVVMDGMDHEKIHPETPEILRMLQDSYPDAAIHHTNLEHWGKELEQYKSQLPVKAGELNETGKKKGGFVYLITHTLSSRYPIKQANDICQTLLEKWVEPLTAVTALRGFQLQRNYIDLAYRHLLQNHPHDSICGCSIDQVHKDMEYRFDQCRMIGKQLIDEALHFERDLRPLDEQSQERVLLLWNPLPFPRREVVTVDIDFNTDYTARYREPFGYEEKNSFKIYDHQGNEIPYGLVSMKKDYLIRRYNQYVEKADVHTISLEVDVPALGSAEYRIVPFDAASRYLKVLSASDRQAENEWLRLKINDNGTVEIFDKTSGKIYGDLISYIDDGEIGDGWYHANPAEDRAICSNGSACRVERVENGPSRTVFRVTTQLQVPKEMDFYRHGIRRSQEYTTLQITSLIGLSKGARQVDVETTVDNNAKDHRLKLRLPTGITTPAYFASQAFAFVERSTGIDINTQDWKECEVPEKQMGGIVGKRAEDGTGLAFVSAYGLHECTGAEDAEGSLLVTLFRSFRKTVMTNGEEGGQIQGSLTFRYALLPLQSSDTYAGLARAQDCLASGMQATNFRVAGGYALQKPHSYLELSDGSICMSILKQPEDRTPDSIILRLYNLSAQPEKAELKCFRPIAEAREVNLNEEDVQAVPSSTDSFQVELGPWKIKTFRLNLLPRY